MQKEAVVYVVDDDPAVLEAIALSLQLAGLRTECYPSAEAFLAAWRPERAGCLLLDVRMPGMSGLELQQVLAARRIRLPVIFITAHGSIPMSVQAMKAGAVDFLEKPFTRQALLSRVQEALALDARNRDQRAEQRAIQARFGRLTTREQQVLALIAAGQSNKEIAQRLGLSPRTVETHRAHLMEKMQAESLPELVAMAIGCGVSVRGQ